jgi:hypothetical protein
MPLAAAWTSVRLTTHGHRNKVLQSNATALIQQRSLFRNLANIVVSIVLGQLAIVVGMMLARLL